MAIPISVNGKVVFVATIDQLLNFDYQEAIADDDGVDLNNPMFDTVNVGEEYIVQQTVISLEISEVVIEEIDLDEELD
jgi:hypothetical protein